MASLHLPQEQSAGETYRGAETGRRAQRMAFQVWFLLIWSWHLEPSSLLCKWSITSRQPLRVGGKRNRLCRCYCEMPKCFAFYWWVYYYCYSWIAFIHMVNNLWNMPQFMYHFYFFFKVILLGVVSLKCLINLVSIIDIKVNHIYIYDLYIHTYEHYIHTYILYDLFFIGH